MAWTLKVKQEGQETKWEVFDDDELGTMDDILSSLFMNDLEGVEELTIRKVL